VKHDLKLKLASKRVTEITLADRWAAARLTMASV